MGNDNECVNVNIIPSRTRVKQGYFQRDTSLASGYQQIQGLGFPPRNIIFNASIFNTFQYSLGFDDNKNPSCQAQIGLAGIWGATIGYSIWLQQDQANTIKAFANIFSMDADGFTVGWNIIGAKTGIATITYVAYS